MTPEQRARWLSELKRIAAGIDIQAAAPVKSDAALCHLAKQLRALIAELTDAS